MAVPLLKKKVIKKRVKQFKRYQSDRRITVKVLFYHFLNPPFVLSSSFYGDKKIGFCWFFVLERENDESYCRPSLNLHPIYWICKVVIDTSYLILLEQ
uniref:Uncharacterized protein n=1 Tax=Solanum tuberosum TaxID=4113 RepID=M0ZTT3_SOLTU